MQFDIIIQAGQSNAEGSGVGPVEKEYTPTDKVWSLDAPKRVTALPDRMDIVYLDEPFILKIAEECEGDNGKIGNFGLTFAEEYTKAGMLKEGRATLIIRAAIGGTGFSRKEWGVGSILSNKLFELVDYALALDEGNRVVAFLWHQGEHDSVEKNPPENGGIFCYTLRRNAYSAASTASAGTSLMSAISLCSPAESTTLRPKVLRRLWLLKCSISRLYRCLMLLRWRFIICVEITVPALLRKQNSSLC